MSWPIGTHKSTQSVIWPCGSLHMYPCDASFHTQYLHLHQCLVSTLITAESTDTSVQAIFSCFADRKQRAVRVASITVNVSLRQQPKKRSSVIILMWCVICTTLSTYLFWSASRTASIMEMLVYADREPLWSVSQTIHLCVCVCVCSSFSAANE